MHTDCIFTHSDAAYACGGAGTAESPVLYTASHSNGCFSRTKSQAG